jgi:hypothetical protein
VANPLGANSVQRADVGPRASRHASGQNLPTGKPLKEVHPKLLNPLAIGVTLGGQLLDIVAPRPKLRAGYTHEFSLLSPRAVARTGSGPAAVDEFVGLPVASGRSS